jgi:glycerol-3-phosphate acyltransferase PlsY
VRLAPILVAFAGAYLTGCIVTGYYVVRWRTGGDLRALGSGTTGARNASRIVGARWGIATALIDVAKGALAVLAARALHLGEWAELAAALGVVVGHVWPLQLRFQGGKGAATAGGALCAIDPRLALSAFALAIAIAILLRDTQRGGLIAVAATPFLALALARHANAVAAALFLTLLLIWTHRRDRASGAPVTTSQRATAKSPSAQPPCDD